MLPEKALRGSRGAFFNQIDEMTLCLTNSMRLTGKIAPLTPVSMSSRLLVWILLPMLLIPMAYAQNSTSVSQSRSAPKISGRLIDNDGFRTLTLGFTDDSQPNTFTGSINSTCLLPDPSKSGTVSPLKLSSIPIGTRMTLFYVSGENSRKAAQSSRHFILAIRFDRVRHGSTLPQGITIPCFKAGGPGSH